ncbi:hypothetical protein Q7C36_019627 [Tachysurus vachellii]|uniref:Uncharacterized protein n=1 Tax=Tachysurus vachellii TaxID=175792 RepID=A0AA88LS45_TACVA|nr:hypothetical protein Q7C36_019627 [Tachysurus vachellii]
MCRRSVSEYVTIRRIHGTLAETLVNKHDRVLEERLPRKEEVEKTEGFPSSSGEKLIVKNKENLKICGRFVFAFYFRMRLSSGLFGTMDRGAHGLSECPHGLTFLVVFLMESLTVTAANLEPIYWNSFNSSHRESKSDGVSLLLRSSRFILLSFPRHASKPGVTRRAVFHLTLAVSRFLTTARRLCTTLNTNTVEGK